MNDYRELFEAIYSNIIKLHGLIKDNEQDLCVVDKADSLMENAKIELLYLSDRVYRYVSNAQHPDQNTDFMFSDISNSPNASASPPEGNSKHNQQQSSKQAYVTDESDEEVL